MPIGAFLDSLPPILFIVAHLVFLSVGVWAATKAAKDINWQLITRMKQAATIMNVVISSEDPQKK